MNGASDVAAEKPLIEAEIVEAYVAAGFAPPEYFVWLGSPLALALVGATAANLGRLCHDLAGPIKDRVWRGGFDDREAIEAQPEWPGSPQDVAGRIAWPIQDQIAWDIASGDWRCAWPAIPLAIKRQAPGYWELIQHGAWMRAIGQNAQGPRPDVPDPPIDEEDPRLSVTCSVTLGANDLLWANRNVFVQRHFGHWKGIKVWPGAWAVARIGGFWLAGESVCFLAEPPLCDHRDEAGDPHHPDGPALFYPDGWRVWAVHGFGVRARMIETPRSINLDDVAWAATEDPRLADFLINRFGGSRGRAAQAAFFAAAGGQPISTEDITHKMTCAGLAAWRAAHGDGPVTCRLYRNPFWREEPTLVLVVVCPSTGEETPLSIPPTFRSAARARAWTFGRDLTRAVET